MYLKELTNEEFNQFTEHFIQSSMYQTAEYAFLMNTQGYDSVLLGLIDDKNQIVAASLVLIHKKYGFKYAYAPRGFLLDYTNITLLETFTNAIKKYLGKKDIIAIKICPMIVKSLYDKKYTLVGVNKNFKMFYDNLRRLGYYHLGFNHYFEALKPRYEAVLDLKRPTYMLFKDFSRGMKNKIRSSIHKGVKIYKGSTKELEELYLQNRNVYNKELSYFDSIYQYFGKKGQVDFFYAKLDTNYYLTLAKQLYENQESYNSSLNNILLSKNIQKKDAYITKKIQADKKFEAYKKQMVKATNLLRDYPDGVIIATALTIRYRDTVYLYTDSYDKNLKDFCGKHLLLWSLIQKYSKEGFHYFNLGGATNVTLKENVYKGLNDFKAGFGSTFYEYIGDFELITNQGLYFMYKNTAPIRNIFGSKNKPSKRKTKKEGSMSSSVGENQNE